MSSANVAKDNKEAIQLTEQAHIAELAGNHKEAYDLHTKAWNLLGKVVANGQKKSEERRRAKLQLRAAYERRDALRACAEDRGTAPKPLPTFVTAANELMDPDPGIVRLTLVEMGTWRSLKQHSPQDHDESNTPTPLTPLLPSSAPDVVYHVYHERFTRGLSLAWLYFHVKDDTKSQILYTVAAAKSSGYQIPLCMMSRATEYHGTCAQIKVTPVKPVPDSRIASRLLGRPFTIAAGTGTTIVVAPDRVEKEWTPRRFTYGGRRFVWKRDRASLFSLVSESLYEVQKEWGLPGSKTGKMQDETFQRPIVRLENKIATSKACVIHIVGGLDQIFREFLLADVVTKQIIEMYGH